MSMMLSAFIELRKKILLAFVAAKTLARAASILKGESLAAVNGGLELVRRGCPGCSQINGLQFGDIRVLPELDQSIVVAI